MEQLSKSTAGKPAVILPGIVTEQDRAIVARREAGETRKAIAASFGIPVSQVQSAEWRCRRDAKGRKLLAECADSIEGLSLTRQVDPDTAFELQYHHNHCDSPPLTRLSEVAAFGRNYRTHTGDMWRVVRGTGATRLELLDRALASLGIAWSPIDRTPKLKSLEPERDNSQSHDAAWRDIVARVARLERFAGRSVLGDDPDRDSIDGVLLRLSFLTGYLEELAASRSRGIIDVTPDDDADDSGEDLETAGNLVCLPGVKLSDVLGSQNDGGRP
jgi:hypothetical protein